jgi:hypothetical protein
MTIRRTLAGAACAAFLALVTWGGQCNAQVSTEEANASNNPLNPAPSLNLQNYYTPRLFGSDAHTNDFLLRGTLPILPRGLVGVPQILRVTAPLSTRPRSDGTYDTGLGDINLFDIFLLTQTGVQVGVGPLLTMPTATDASLGTGKWQAGVAAVIIDPTPARLIGALIQWQHSFAGQSSRPAVQGLTVQPFGIFNLPGGWYIRSTGVWSFDLQRGSYYIPIGMGAGKAWKEGKTIFNAFIEPQYTVAHDGNGVPQWTVFAGLNMTFGG